QEAKERVRAAIRNAGARMPHGRVTINLAPADVRKEGPAYDLPIALGMFSPARNEPTGVLSTGEIWTHPGLLPRTLARSGLGTGEGQDANGGTGRSDPARLLL
ncbi:MAG TPA: magnesium chelatase domain-containing protein, partial [Thermomicrobiales bacterium]|nr:magnesium chelatase domain-containing protein [Thermomicrobiales bacterium]